MSLEQPDFTWPVRVYFEDTDAGGVVYHAGYLRYYERCRTEWLRARGHSQQALLAGEEGLAFAVRSMNVEWMAPARLDDRLDVHLYLRQLRRASLIAEQRIVRTDDGVLLSTAQVRVACIRAPEFRPLAIPDALLESLTA